MPNVMVTEGDTFGRCWGHEGAVLMNRTRALKKKPHRALSPFFILQLNIFILQHKMCGTVRRHWLRVRKLTLTRMQPCWHPILLPASLWNWEISFVCKAIQSVPFCYRSLHGLGQTPRQPKWKMTLKLLIVLLLCDKRPLHSTGNEEGQECNTAPFYVARTCFVSRLMI